MRQSDAEFVTRPLWLLLACLGCAFLLGLSAFQSEQSTQSSQARSQTLQQYGMIVPRPVDPEQRKQRGYADPREASVVLAAIDGIAEAMIPILAENDVWKQRFREYRQLQRDRVSLISELEEGGYTGNRLMELVATKSEDAAQLCDRGQFPFSAYATLQSEITRRYPDHDVARIAEWAQAIEKIHMICHGGFHVAQRDFEKLAEIDLQMPDLERAGILLLEALHYAQDDKPLTEKWHEWMLANLAPETSGYRAVIRRRMFGSPIHLTGEGLDGRTIDTREMKGNVILVDFWGTWCVPCMEAMPHLKQMQDKYGDRGLRIVGVLCDHELDKAREFLREKGYDWPQFAFADATPRDYIHPIAQQYAVGAYPTLWIIDRNGDLREEADRDRLDEQIKLYLDEKPGKPPA